jgi:hypothetical protein
MTRFTAGLIVGLLLGACASAYAARCIGYGTAFGWTVTHNGDELCSDPIIHGGAKEIECD